MFGNFFPNLSSIISEKMRGYPQFSFWILIALAKICFLYSLKDVRAKNFYSTDFSILCNWLQSDNELPMSEMEKNWGVTDFVFEIKRVKNYPNFDNSALVTRHGLSAC